MIISDYGIILEIFGFFIMLLIGGRSPNPGSIATDGFDRIRQKIIPPKFITMSLIIGIASIVLGLSFQLSFV